MKKWKGRVSIVLAICMILGGMGSFPISGEAKSESKASTQTEDKSESQTSAQTQDKSESQALTQMEDKSELQTSTQTESGNEAGISLLTGENANTSDLYQMDFEDTPVDSLPAGWSLDDAAKKDPSATYAKVTAFKENKVLAFQNADGSSHAFAKVALPGSYTKMVLSYSFALEKANGVVYLPMAGKDNNMNAILGSGVGATKGSGYTLDNTNWTALQTKEADGTWKDVGAFEALKWYTVKAVFDTENAEKPLEIYLDGKLTNAAVKTNTTPINRINMRMTKWAGTDILYVDNVRVTEGDHDPVKPAEIEEDMPVLPETYQQDFNDSTDMPKEWTTGNTTGGSGTLKVVNVDDAHGNALMLSRTVGNKGVVKANTKEGLFQEKERAVLEYKIKTSGNAVMYLPSLFGNKGKSVNLIYENGNICYQVNGKNNVITALSATEWHSVKLVVDQKMKEWYLYLDGDFLTKQSVLLNTEKMNSIGFSTLGSSQSIPAMYFDDFSVTSYVAGESVAFDNAPKSVPAGVPTKLALKFTPDDTSCSSADFTSSNESIATVDANGVVTGLKAGNVIITATPHGGELSPVSTEITILTTDVTGIHVGEKMVTLPVGGHKFVEASVLPENASFQELLYESQDPQIATVDEWGEIVALKAGTATIKVICAADPEIVETFTVTVTDAAVMDRIYVSVNGSETGNGSEADKVSLKRALELVDEKNDNMTGNIEVVLEDGYYYLDKTLEITEKHGGTNNYSVVFIAEKGANPVIGSGYDIKGSAFTKWSENETIYVVDVPEWLNSRQLFVDQVRAVRARSKGGLSNVTFLFDANGENIGYESTDVELAQFSKITDLELVFKAYWTNSRCGVAKAEAADGKVRLTMDQPGWRYLLNKGQTKVPATGPVYYENALELLDEPGEWYLDTDANKLYYMPRAWETMSQVTVTVPAIDGELVTITGDSYDNAVQNIHFEGITFADTTWLRPNGPNGHPDVQNNHTREDEGSILHTAAVVVKRANGVWFSGCTFTRLGINGLQMIDGTQNCFVTGNHFTDISSDAINIGNQWDYGAGAAANAFVKNCDVNNNYIHDIGVDFGSSAAISIGFAADIDSTHNEIFNIPYSGYHIGYGWGKRFDNVLKNAVISNNFVHDLLGEGIFDGGAIYIIGNSANQGYNLVKENYLKNQMERTGVLYSDQGVTYWEWLENVVDLSEVDKWGSAAPVWAFINPETEHVKYVNTYTTTPISQYGYNKSVDFTSENGVSITGTSQYDPAACPQRVAEIIEKSGLEADFASLRNGQAERIVTNVPKTGKFVMEPKDTFTISVSFTDGKDRKVSGGESHVYYEVVDQNVAEVTSSGVLTAKAGGKTTLRITVISNHILDVLESEIYVADEPSKILLDGFDDTVSMSEMNEGLALDVSVETAMGRVVVPEEVTYKMENLSIATVDAKGYVKPVKVGSTKLTVTVVAEGKTFSQDFTVVITEAMKFVEDDLSEIFSDEYKNNWQNAGASNWALTENTDLSMKLDGFVTFTGCKYQNELMHFKMKIDTSTGGGGWPAVVFRAQDAKSYVAGGTTGYIICFGRSGLELHRFNGGQRTVIYGNIKGLESIGGDMITPQPLTHGEEHDVKVGALNNGNNVRLYLEIDGKVVFDFEDKSKDAIKNAGYFGLVGRKETFTLTKAAVENVEGYTAGITAAENEYAVGDTILIPISVFHKEDTAFHAAEIKVSYNEEVMTFDQEASTLKDAAVKAENGVLTLEDYGTQKAFEENVYVLAFEAIKEATTADVTLTKAAFSDAENAKEKDLEEAKLNPSKVALTITKAPLNVTLDRTMFTGESKASYGKDYTFGLTENGEYYDYIFNASMKDENGNPASVNVIDNGNGTYTINNVTGELVIGASRTAKSYDVSFAGSAGEETGKMTGNEVKASYGTDYSFRIPENTDDYVYAVESITIGGGAYTGYTVNGTTVTVAGADVKGNLVITVSKTAIPVEYVTVTVEGNGAGAATGYDKTAQKRKAYTLKLNKKAGYVYEVTAKMADASGTYKETGLSVDGDSYTIAKVTGNVIFTIQKSLDIAGISVSDTPYLKLQGTNMWLVQCTTEAEEGETLAFDGGRMFWSEKYNEGKGAYCYLVIADSLNAEEAKSKVSIVSDAKLSVDYGMDVNITGKVDANDAQLVYDMYNAAYNEFSESVSMEKFLRADVNGDRKITVEDAAAIIYGILGTGN